MRLITFVTPSDDVTVLIGAKTKREVFFEDLANRLLEKNSHKVLVSTEDGTCGEKGLVTDLVEKITNETKFDAIYTCGPELMMYKIVQISTKKRIFVQASLERMMKCGVGICGSCCIGEYLVCRDGTVFDGDRLLLNKEFGHAFRTKAGILENY
jgi:dihydroorotate dehydrogenase electron transfer subunit